MTPFNQLMDVFNNSQDETKIAFMVSLAQEFKFVNTDPKLIIDIDALVDRFRKSKEMVVGRYEECFILVYLKSDYIVFSTPQIKHNLYYSYRPATPSSRSVAGKSYAAAINQFSLGYEPVLNNIISLFKNHMKRVLFYRNKEAKSRKLANDQWKLSPLTH